MLLAGWPRRCLGEEPPFLDLGSREPVSRPITRCLLLFESKTKLQLETLLGMNAGCQSIKLRLFSPLQNQKILWKMRRQCSSWPSGFILCYISFCRWINLISAYFFYLTDTTTRLDHICCLSDYLAHYCSNHLAHKARVILLFHRAQHQSKATGC
jgi:hypothetical protein